MTASARRIVGALGVLCLAASGCVEREAAVSDPHIQSTAQIDIQQLATTKVDMLFVIDDSTSMKAEQTILAEQIVEMARELIHPSDADAPTVEDLHIGIVSTDVGAGGYTYEGCSGRGDDGALQNEGLLEGCADTFGAAGCELAGGCPWLEHSTEAPDDGSDGTPPIWDDFGCIATLGTGGCGFEQQLEASLVALTTQAAPGMRNEGFLREDSLLAIVYVSDEDDCSTGNGELFTRAPDTVYGPANTRCALHPEELYPIDRYVQGFRGLRPGREDMVVVAAITGVPIDGSWRPGDPLEQLREMVVVDPSDDDEIVASCTSPAGNGDADPPVRFVELAYAFETNGVLASICESDWRPALQSITNKIREKILGTCMPTELASTAADTCHVVETLRGDGQCPGTAVGEGGSRSSGWHVDLGLNEEGNRVCEILPADYDGDGCPDRAADCGAEDYSGSLAGWFYDSDNPQCPHGRVRFTSRDVTGDLSAVRFECRTARCPDRRSCSLAALEGDDCDPDAQGACGEGSVCVRHTSGEVCGWATVETTEGGQELRPMSCAKCSLTVGARCESSSLPDARWGLPLVDEGGCCAEGFHCEDTDVDGVADACLPNRTTDCD